MSSGGTGRAMALLVLGLGNDLLGDDAVGLLAAASLEGRLGPGIRVARSGRSGLYLVEELEGYDDAIILDSVLGEEPGRVRELPLAEMNPSFAPSAHYAGLPEALSLAQRAGIRMPRRVRVFAVEIPAIQTIGAGPAVAVRCAADELASRAVDAAREWGYEAGEVVTHA